MNEVRKGARVQPHQWRPVLLRVGIVVTLAAVIAVVMAMNLDSPLSMDKIRATVATGDGKILHMKTTVVDTDGNTSWSETWTYDQTHTTEDYDLGSGKYRGLTQTGDQAVTEEALDGQHGLRQVYDADTDTIFERRDTTEWGRQEVLMRIGEQPNYQDSITQSLDFGKARDDGHEQVDGRDALRIIREPDLQSGEVDETLVFLVDAETGLPLELRAIGAEGTRVLHFEAYEKLTATPENLALLDLRSVHPSATVNNDPVAFERFTTQHLPNGEAAALAVTPEGAILHAKRTYLGGSWVESWTYHPSADSPIKYRDLSDNSDHRGTQEYAADGARSIEEYYDATTDTIYVEQSDTIRSRLSQWRTEEDIIRELLSSGRGHEDGHEVIDGRDALRIVEEQPASSVLGDTVYLVDALTGAPIEFRGWNEEGRTVIHYDIWEWLPATPENLALTDLRAQHPGATVNTDQAAVAQFLQKPYPPQGSE